MKAVSLMLLIALVWLALPAVAMAEAEVGPAEPEGGWLTKERYVAGGVTGLLVSFGTGHMIAGEWTNFGWFYTTTQVVGTGLLVGGFVLWEEGTVDAEEIPGYEDMTEEELNRAEREMVDEQAKIAGMVMLGTGAGILGLSLIAEKIDYWVRTSPRVLPEHLERPSPRFGCRNAFGSSCITEDEYVRAGLVGTFVGFGAGHFMTGETGRGGAFMVSELLFLGIVGAGGVLIIGAGEISVLAGASLVLAGGIGLVGLRIWEKYDIWKRPRHDRSMVGKGDGGPAPVAMTPTLAPALGNNGVGGAVVGLSGSF